MCHFSETNGTIHTEAIQIPGTAKTITTTQLRMIKKLPILRGRTAATTFLEDSTRTRLSFGTAAKQLSTDVISFSTKGLSPSEGESLKNTAQTIVAIGAETLIIRHSASGVPHRLAHYGWVNIPILNGGDGTYQHPTQALLGSFTLRHHLYTGQDKVTPESSGLADAYAVTARDIPHSRIARSNVDPLSLLGVKVIPTAPPTLLPVGMEDWLCEVSYTLDDVLTSKPEAAMMLRVQRGRVSSADGGFFSSSEEYSRQYGLNVERLSVFSDDAVLMHPDPMSHGPEVSADTADSVRSVALEQVANGISVRMAALYLLLAYGEETSA